MRNFIVIIEDGGNSIDDDWPGEPIEPYWRKQLDIAEEELRQVSLTHTVTSNRIL